MLNTLIEHHGACSRGILFHYSATHESGYRVLARLMELGLVKTSVTGSYMNGNSPVTHVSITAAGVLVAFAEI